MGWAAPAQVLRLKTHCVRGHEYTPENTYRKDDGYRRCCECRREGWASPSPSREGGRVNAAQRRYRDDAARRYPDCVCGAPAEQQHHIIHVNHQRITKDEMLVVGLCGKCHQGRGGVHDLGGEAQFLEATGHDLVQLAVLRRHDWEVRNA